MDLSDLPTGNYLLQVNDGNHTETKKLVKY
ncbi:MAG: T9SS type A sorting domain-containing protein [Taibaiella sp.]|nr:T9SS type A sorting domain-containing protein [Taibaiella sp.]